MFRILVADEGKGTPDGLLGQLANHAGWTVQTAGIEAARRALESAAYEVVMTGPGLRAADSAELLQQAHLRQPLAVRLALCRQASVDEMHRLMSVAHQVLGSGGDVRSLERCIERICRLLRQRGQPGMQRVLGMLARLPVLPRVYWELAAELERASADSASVAAIIEQDPVVTTRVLQLANSAFFGVQRSVRSVRDAATVLGLEPLRSVALLAGLSRLVHAGDLPGGFSLEALQGHSARVARLAAAMLNDPEESKTAFSAGMLHHIGYLMLAVNLPRDYQELREAAFRRNTSMEQAELEVLGCSHADIGAQTLALWGLPLPLIDAVAFHHRPSGSGELRFGAATAVHVAAALADEAEGKPADPAALEWDFLRRLNAAAPVERWRRGEPVRPF
ncbi:MAG TPA: HDOD domain-containing protein [Nevskia sp.]|nr:HDOD domain-containing protein [Nevskia sp.]